MTLTNLAFLAIGFLLGWLTKIPFMINGVAFKDIMQYKRILNYGRLQKATNEKKNRL